MAKQKKGEGMQGAGSSKFRAVGIFLVIIAILVAFYVYFFHLRDSDVIKTKVAVSKAPAISAVTGSESVTPEFVKLLEEESIARAREAERRGKSAISTVVRPGFRGPSEFDIEGKFKKGCSPAELRRAREAGVSAFELRCRGCSAAAMRAAGYTAGELAAAGFSAKELKDAGFSAAELRAAGFSAQQLKDAGFTVDDLRSAGFSASELAASGYTPDELRFAGFTQSDLKAAGIGVATPANMPTDCNIASLRKARADGISAAQLKKLGCGAAALKAAGFTAKELKEAGFTAAQLKAAGFSAKELKEAGFTAGELRAAGFSAKNLKDAGFTAAELKAAGYSADELRIAGYTRDQLKAAGFSGGDLLRAGFEPEVAEVVERKAELCDQETLQQMREKKVPISVIRKLGCPEERIAAAGYDITAPPEVVAVMPVSDVVSISELREAELTAQQRQEEIEKLQDRMRTTASTLFGTWAPPPTQDYVEAEEPKTQAATGEGAEGAAAGGQQVGPDGKPIPTGPTMPIKAGDILFGTIDTGINSDEESPILASVVSGKLKGARLVGAFTVADTRVVLNFNTMSVPWLTASVSVKAVAVDPNTARTALASNVNNHYFLRFGTLFASSFLSGLADAITQSGGMIAATVGGVVTTSPALSSGEKFLVALGKVGTEYANVLGENFNRKPTITVNAGCPIGILFMADTQIPLPKKDDDEDVCDRGCR